MAHTDGRDTDAARNDCRGCSAADPLIVGVVVLLVLTVWATVSTPEGCTPDDCLLHPAIVIVPSFGFAIVWMTVSAVATANAEPTLPESGTDPVDASRDEQ